MKLVLLLLSLIFYSQAKNIDSYSQEEIQILDIIEDSDFEGEKEKLKDKGDYFYDFDNVPLKNKAHNNEAAQKMMSKDDFLVIESKPSEISTINSDSIGFNDDLNSFDESKDRLDEFDQNALMMVLGQMYLDQQRNQNYPVDSASNSKEASPLNSKSNNRVNLNFNNVKLQHTVLNAGNKPEVQVNPVNQFPDYMPMSQTKSLYLNLNMADAVILGILCVALIFVIKKAYQKCSNKQKNCSPNLPTSSPPTYVQTQPSTVIVEKPSKN